MLVISRREEETLVIETSDGTITVKVLHISPSKVRLGVDAPEIVQVSRT